MRSLLLVVSLFGFIGMAEALPLPVVKPVVSELNSSISDEAVEIIDDPSPEDILFELDQEQPEGVPSESQIWWMNMADQPLQVIVDKSEQRLYVYERGQLTGSWLVSTGKEKRVCTPSGRCYFASTPNGEFGVVHSGRSWRMYKDYTSSAWGAKMPYAIFFNGGIALHATSETAKLGSKASGGCVRQSLSNAKKLFNLVLHYGPGNVGIRVQN